MNETTVLNSSDVLAMVGHLSPTKEKILYTAIDMFSTEGYSAVSVRDITKEVGIKESSLYNHFQNKEDILETIYAIFTTQYNQLMPTSEQLDAFIAKTSPEEFLAHGYQIFMNLMHDEVIGAIWRIIQMEQYRNPRAGDILLNIVIKGTLSFLEDSFQKMMDLNYIPPMNASLLAAEFQYPIFAMGSEYNILKFRGLDTTEIEGKMSCHVQYFLQSVRKI